MGSLLDLNTYSQTTVSFTDERNPGPRYNLPEVFDQAFTSLTNQFTINRAGLEIIEIVRPDDADIKLVVDVSAVTGATVTWSTTPAGCTITEVDRVYTMDGIDTVDIWDTVKNPVITVPPTFQGSFFYTVSVTYLGINGFESISWQVGTFVPVSEFTNTFSLSADVGKIATPTIDLECVSECVSEIELAGLGGATGVTNFLASTNDVEITNNPTIIYPAGSETWTIVISASDTSHISGFSSDGDANSTTSYDIGLKTYTIAGQKDSVNSHLNTLSFDSGPTKADFTFTYTATKSDEPSFLQIRTQTANCLNLDRLTEPRGSATYTTASASTIGTALPQISDPDYTAQGQYEFTVTPTNAALVANITSTGINAWGTSATIERGTISGRAANAYSFDFGDYSTFSPSGNTLFIRAPLRLGNTTYTVAYPYALVSGSYVYQQSAIDIQDTRTDPLDKIQVSEDDLTVLIESTSSLTTRTLRVYHRNTREDGTYYYTLNQTITGDDSIVEFSASENCDVLAISDNLDGQSDQGPYIHIYTRTGLNSYVLSRILTAPTETALPGEDSYPSEFGSYFSVSPTGTRIAVYSKEWTANSITIPAKIRIYQGSGSTWSLVKTFVAGTDTVSTGFNWNPGGDRLYVKDGDDLIAYDANNSWAANSAYAVTASSGYELATTADQNSIQFNSDETVAMSNYDATGQAGFAIYYYESGAWVEQLLSNQVSTNNYMDHSGTKIAVDASTSDTDLEVDLFTYGPQAGTFNATTKAYTITGTKTQVNADIDTITLTSAAGVVNPIELTSSVLTPESNTDSKTQTANNTG